jgi:hypothetical protein
MVLCQSIIAVSIFVIALMLTMSYPTVLRSVLRLLEREKNDKPPVTDSDSDGSTDAAVRDAATDAQVRVTTDPSLHQRPAVSISGRGDPSFAGDTRGVAHGASSLRQTSSRPGPLAVPDVRQFVVPDVSWESSTQPAQGFVGGIESDKLAAAADGPR